MSMQMHGRGRLPFEAFSAAVLSYYYLVLLTSGTVVVVIMVLLWMEQSHGRGS